MSENVKTVYLYNGTPYLAIKDENNEFQYPKEKWTEEAPPLGIYAPFYFDGQQWIGQTKEEFEKNLNQEPTNDVNTDEVMANLTLQIAQNQSEITSLKEDISKLTLIVANLTGGSTNG